MIFYLDSHVNNLMLGIDTAISQAAFCIESLRSMYTASPVNFCVISMFAGCLACYRMKSKNILWLMLTLACLTVLMAHEICYTAKNKENYFKLLGIPRSASSSEFNSAIRSLKGKYHPDNIHTGDNDMFIRLNELSAAMDTHYKKRIELYEIYGDSYDITSQYPPNKDDETALATYRVIELVANYIMISLIAVLFYQNSAKRGIFQKVFLTILVLLACLIDVILDHKFNGEEGDDDFEFSEMIRELFKVPYATIPEVITLWRLMLVMMLSVFYFHGILFQHKEEDILLAKTQRYYLKIYRMTKTSDQQGENYNPEKDIEESWKLLDALKPSIDYIKKYCGHEKAEGFFNFLHSILHYVYYGFIAGIIGLNLYYKYEDDIRAWINKKPDFKY